MTYFQTNRYISTKKVNVGGQKYDSKFEAGYGQELDLRKKAGDIKDYARQVKLDLSVNGYHICNYYIDFVVTNKDGSKDYVELKGLSMPVFRLKWKLFEALFDTDFKEHPDDKMTLIMQQSKWKTRR